MEKLHLGAQLYTVRDHCQTEADFRDTMKKIAEIGYKYVQISGVGGAVSEDTIVEATKENGLGVILTHYDAMKILRDTDRVIEYHDRLGCSAIGIGGIPYPRTMENYVRFCDEFAPAIEKIKKAGKIFLYHNHHLEFEKYDGVRAIDYLLAHTDPDAVKLTFDAYWAHFGGADETQFVIDHADRIFATHTKDMTVRGGSPAMTEMLTGNINYKRFFDTCLEKGVLWHFVEQDVCVIDSIESMKVSHDNLKGAFDFD